MKKIFITLVAFLFVVIAGFETGAPANYDVPFPEGYRAWTHIKTTLSLPADTTNNFNRGFHHIYANEKAMEGYRTGLFPEGSVCIFDVLEANVNNGNTTEGKRKRVDVMIKDSVKYKDTGGWGYGQFIEDNKTMNVLNADKSKACFQCHTKEKDYVFSAFRN